MSDNDDSGRIRVTPQLVAGTYFVTLDGSRKHIGAVRSAAHASATPGPVVREKWCDEAPEQRAAKYTGVRWNRSTAQYEAFLQVASCSNATACDADMPGPRTHTYSFSSPKLIKPVKTTFRYYVSESALKDDAHVIGSFATAEAAARAYDAAVILRLGDSLAGYSVQELSEILNFPLQPAQSLAAGDGIRSTRDDHSSARSTDQSESDGAVDAVSAPPDADCDHQEFASSFSISLPAEPLLIISRLIAFALGWLPPTIDSSDPDSDCPVKKVHMMQQMVGWARRAMEATPAASASMAKPVLPLPPPPPVSPSDLRPFNLPSLLSRTGGHPLRGLEGVALPGGCKAVVYRCAVTVADCGTDAGDEATHLYASTSAVEDGETARKIFTASVPQLPTFASPSPLAISVRLQPQLPVRENHAIGAGSLDGVDRPNYSVTVRLSAFSGSGPADVVTKTILLDPDAIATAVPIAITIAAAGCSFDVSCSVTRVAVAEDDFSAAAYISPRGAKPSLSVAVLAAFYEEQGSLLNLPAVMQQHRFLTEVPSLSFLPSPHNDVSAHLV